MADAEVRRVREVYAARAGGYGLYDQRRPEQVALLTARQREWGRALLAHAGPHDRLLEVGSGTGAVLRWGRDVGFALAAGVDVTVDRLALARDTNPRTPGVAGDGTRLPVRDASVDAVVASTLFSSVLDDQVATLLAAEMRRVLRPGGLVLWHDLRVGNPGNADVRAVRRADIARLFPGFAMELRTAVLAPPLARRLSRFPRLSAWLETFPPARSHLVGALVAPREPGRSGPR